MLAYSPQSVANYFIEQSNLAGKLLDPMQIQKLVYFAHGWRLGRNGEPLIDQPIEAWDYGPVVRSLYLDLKHFGARPVTQPIEATRSLGLGGFQLFVPKMDDVEAKQFLNRIWEVYGKLSGPQLSELTHRPDTPWSQTRNATNGARDAVIPQDLMREYFTRLLQQNVAKRAAG